MNSIDRKAFLEIVIGFAELKGKVLSAPALELFWNAMQGWSLPDFQLAANELVRTCEFMPTPKDFEDLRRAGRQTPGEAWTTARQHLRWGLHTYTLDPACPPLIARCVHMLGGPNVVAMCEESKLTFLERRFTEHFHALQESNDIREAVPGLAYGDDRPRIAGSFKALGK